MTDVNSHTITTALASVAVERPLRAGAQQLLNALGYSSQRTTDTESIEDFLERFAPDGKLTARQRELFESLKTVEIVFQFTATEISAQSRLFNYPDFDEGRVESFLFVAVDTAHDTCTRTHLAQITRVVNRLFAMPVILLFRHGSSLTVAATHRRANKQDDNLDVLEKVTLVKDIQLVDSHRAHIEILTDLAFPRMVERGVSSFDQLHTKWEQTLDIDALNKRFYREVFVWFERAVKICSFPYDGAGEGASERHVIRLITRILFIWFLKEKRLVPEELFHEQFAQTALTNHAPDNTHYYRAVLQNLFFGTLNTEIEKRSFINDSDTGQSDINAYRYRDLMTDPKSFVEKFEKVPFVNGGLFDCLDDFETPCSGGKLIDAFTDDPGQGNDLYVPASLFLDPKDGLFALFLRYKFTIEESTPLDREVALDPELLGCVFENLLAAYNPETRETARKNTGSYYTPRPVVDYMVREALTEAITANSTPADEDVNWWRERLEYLLDHSNSKDDASDFFDEVADRKAVVTAIAKIRTLDPAVGSGAFPMSILQTLTLALRRIDPDNTIWEEIQKKRARERAIEAFDTRNHMARDEALREISATFEKYRRSDFGRKLYIIQNGIYGVDIQPIACQIAKLRFFISLVIEQDPCPSSPNLGIRPLPNLETRFMAADTLLRLDRPRQKVLGETGTILELEQKVAENRERHFHTGDRSKKIEIQEKDAQLRSQMAKHLEQAGFPLRTAETIASWDPYDQNANASWFDAKYMFGVSGGFDIVIGNPPYIQLQKNSGRAGKLYEGAGYETYQRTGDIYQLFFERGCQLLKLNSGILAYITSNSWLKAKYGRSLRKYFSDRHTPLTLVEMGKDVFDNAIVDTAVLIARSGKVQPKACRAVDIELTSRDQFPPPFADWGTLQPKGEQPWMALSPIERAVMEKMEAVGTPLKEWDISIYYGIKTGFNDAFIVDQATRDALVAEDPKSTELLKPILRGRDIARYHANWAGLWLIDTHNGYDDISPIDVNDYPAVKAHLSKFIARLERRQDKGITPFNLRNCAYHEEFSKKKLFWMHLSPYGRFARGEKGMMCNQKCFMVTGRNLEFLSAVLNSTLVTWMVKHTAVTTGMGLCQWDKYIVEQIPVICPDDSTLEWFNDAVGNLLEPKEIGDLNSAVIQRAIDQAVFDLYGVTTKEVSALKGQKVSH